MVLCHVEMRLCVLIRVVPFYGPMLSVCLQMFAGMIEANLSRCVSTLAELISCVLELRITYGLDCSRSFPSSFLMFFGPS